MKILKLNFFALFVCLYKPQEFPALFCKVQADGSVIGCEASKSSCKARKLTLAKRIAFSLIELMISLITISIIAAAFTPVITKKLSASSITVGSMGGGITEFAPDCSAWGDDCTLCTDKQCALCITVCPVGQFTSTKECNCKSCSEIEENCVQCTHKFCEKCASGYGLTSSLQCKKCGLGTYSNGTTDCIKASAGYYVDTEGSSTQTQCPAGQGSIEGSSTCENCVSNCAQCTTPDICTKCNRNYYLNNGSCTSCTTGYYCNGTATQTACSNTWSNCTECSATACTACDSGYKVENGVCIYNWKTPASQADCDSVFGADITYYHNNLCITRKNVNDTSYAAAITGVSYLSAGSSSSKCSSSSKACCWKGSTTDGDCNASYSFQGYSGCSRTVCNYQGAYTSCNTYDIANTKGKWRLPTLSEISKWGTIAKGSYIDLCGHSSNSSIARCDQKTSSGCYGSYGNFCSPYIIWSGTNYGAYVYHSESWFVLNDANSSQIASYAFSTRCVIDSIPNN